ncbi:DUF2842 domain-containing protein [Palleronia abyssalis]|uniref:DUF2842 domain-containing protein n=1 Tax=Palleronia abyssalis TaxID=1501240 RepID=A0A2R8BXJ2_9RHOB|nr:DUF2842 domain-containing protein [Palleronia abyssalis]SPJ24796.1 hypothetical protein PAA8504_02635 [Palleronia abyssalis]
MALSHKAKRRWSLVILLLGLPVWIVLASSIMTTFGRPPILVELLVYMVLGIAWALPFRNVFLGVGQDDPDKRND